MTVNRDRQIRDLYEAALRQRITDRAAFVAAGAAGDAELQHAVEVLQDPKIVDFNTLFHFYLRTAPTTGEAFETEAARRAGLRVRAEVIAGKKCK